MSVDDGPLERQLSDLGCVVLAEQLKTYRVLAYDEDSPAELKRSWICRTKPGVGGYRYLVLFGAWLTMLAFSSVLVISLLVVPLEKHFRIPNSEASVFVSIQLGLLSVFTLLGVRVNNVLGTWRGLLLAFTCLVVGFIVPSAMDNFAGMVVVYGVIGGLGAALSQIFGMSFVQDWFEPDGKVGLALGVILTASGTGSIIFTYYIQYFLDHYTWREALRYNAVLVAGIGSLALCFARSRTLHDSAVQKIVDRSLSRSVEARPKPAPILAVSLLRRPRMALFITSVAVTTFTVYSCYVSLIPAAITTGGLAPSDAAFLLVIVGIIAVGSRVLYGKAADRLGGIAVMLFTNILHVFAMVIWIYADSKGMYYLLAVWFGLSTAGHIVACSHAPKQLAHPSEVGGALGLTFGLAFAVGCTLIGPMMGWAFTPEDGYYAILVPLACTQALATLALAYLQFVNPERNLPTEAEVMAAAGVAASTSTATSNSNSAGKGVTSPAEIELQERKAPAAASAAPAAAPDAASDVSGNTPNSSLSSSPSPSSVPAAAPAPAPAPASAEGVQAADALESGQRGGLAKQSSARGIAAAQLAILRQTSQRILAASNSNDSTGPAGAAAAAAGDHSDSDSESRARNGTGNGNAGARTGAGAGAGASDGGKSALTLAPGYVSQDQFEHACRALAALDAQLAAGGPVDVDAVVDATVVVADEAPAGAPADAAAAAAPAEEPAGASLAAAPQT